MQLRLLVIIIEGKREMKTEILMNYLEKQTQRERDAGKVEAREGAGQRGHGAYKIRHLIVSLSLSLCWPWPEETLTGPCLRPMRSRRCLQLCPCPCPSPSPGCLTWLAADRRHVGKPTKI